MGQRIRAVVTGVAGKMGGRMVVLLREAADFVLVGATERPGHPALGRDAGELAGAGSVGVRVTDGIASLLPGADVAVDFTAAEASVAHVRAAAAAGKGIVVGTTGLSREQLAEIRSHARRIPCVVSPNMSVGVNVLYRLLAEAARLLGEEYDVELFEAHHRFKKDAPSGTALKMAQVLAEALGRDLEQVGIYGRKGMVGERPRDEIGIHTLRGGDIVGEHTVIFAGLGERIELTHRAHSRDNFGRGALRAARFAARAAPGLYDMGDVLGLKT